MTSGGALNDRISDKVLALMLPTACFASSTNGLISSISSSMAFFRLDKKIINNFFNKPAPLNFTLPFAGLQQFQKCQVNFSTKF